MRDALLLTSGSEVELGVNESGKRLALTLPGWRPTGLPSGDLWRDLELSRGEWLSRYLAADHAYTSAGSAPGPDGAPVVVRCKNSAPGTILQAADRLRGIDDRVARMDVALRDQDAIRLRLLWLSDADKLVGCPRSRG